ncbi:type III secretion system cytoplasmic ring protein SctQ [Inquilinus sp. NPDC058860]|uniref:type III secretion system cytoplasmic ring protein SctQ n=1 Tax=Inquilinus sp. NPDC058860 TaxID=3346652 RepID=UPI00367CAA80
MTAAAPPAWILAADPLASGPAARPYDPPRLTRGQAVDANAVARRCTPMPVRIGGLEIEAPLAITPVLAPSPTPASAGGTAITLRIGSGRLTLLVPALLVEQALADIAGLPAAELEPELAALLLEAAASDVLPVLEAAAGEPIAIESVGPAAAAVAPAFRCTITIRHAFAETALHLAADDAARPALRRVIDAAPALPAPCAGLPVPLAVRIGAVRLSLAELGDLAPGDVVFPDVACPPGEALVVYGEGWSHAARHDRGTLTVAGPRRPLALQDGGGWMADPDSGAATPPAERLGELPVTLVFELGRSELPLAAVQGLAPGAVIPLGRDPGEAVDIVANGRRIGRGEIVRIEDELGIRVVRLFGDE